MNRPECPECGSVAYAAVRDWICPRCGYSWLRDAQPDEPEPLSPIHVEPIRKYDVVEAGAESEDTPPGELGRAKKVPGWDPAAFLEEGVKIGRAMVKEQYAPLVAAAPDIIEYLREVSLTATDSPTLMQFEINRGFRDRTIIIQGWIQILEALKGGEA